MAPIPLTSCMVCLAAAACRSESSTNLAIGTCRSRSWTCPLLAAMKRRYQSSFSLSQREKSSRRTSSPHGMVISLSSLSGFTLLRRSCNFFFVNKAVGESNWKQLGRILHWPALWWRQSQLACHLSGPRVLAGWTQLCFQIWPP